VDTSDADIVIALPPPTIPDLGNRGGGGGMLLLVLVLTLLIPFEISIWSNAVPGFSVDVVETTGICNETNPDETLLLALLLLLPLRVNFVVVTRPAFGADFGDIFFPFPFNDDEIADKPEGTFGDDAEPTTVHCGEGVDDDIELSNSIAFAKRPTKEQTKHCGEDEDDNDGASNVVPDEEVIVTPMDTESADVADNVAEVRRPIRVDLH
jgi:hypothetical protein